MAQPSELTVRFRLWSYIAGLLAGYVAVFSDLRALVTLKCL